MTNETARTTSCSNKISIEAHGLGFWGKVSGADIKSIFVVLIIGLCSGALFVQADKIADAQEKQAIIDKAAFLAAHAQTQSHQLKIITLLGEGQLAVERAQRVQTYVLTLTDAERRSLNLQMPDELKYGYGAGTRKR